MIWIIYELALIRKPARFRGLATAGEPLSDQNQALPGSGRKGGGAFVSASDSGAASGLSLMTAPRTAAALLCLFFPLATDGAQRCKVASGAGAFATLQEAFAAGCREVSLAAGRHAGGVTLPEKAIVRGEAGAIIVGPDGGTALKAPRGARIEEVTLEGGETGLAGAQLELRSVSLLGQRRIAIEASGSVRLAAVRVELQREARALTLTEGSRAVLDRLEVRGPGALGIESSAQRLELSRSRIEGPATALQQRGGEVWLRELTLRGGGASAGLALVRARGRVSGVRIHGFEHGLLTQRCEGLVVEDLSSYDAHKAGVGLVQSEVRLREVRVFRSGTFGAIQVIGGRARVEDFWIHQASEIGVLSRSGQLELRRGRITGVSSRDGTEGSALVVLSGQARLDEVLVRNAAGYAILALTNAKVIAGELTVEGAGTGALAADTGAQLQGRRLTARQTGGALLMADGDAQITLASVVSTANPHGIASSPCTGQTRIVVRRLQGPDSSAAASGRCIELR